MDVMGYLRYYRSRTVGWYRHSLLESPLSAASGERGGRGLQEYTSKGRKRWECRREEGEGNDGEEGKE